MTEETTSWKTHSSFTLHGDANEDDDNIAYVINQMGTSTGSVRLSHYNFDIPNDAEVTGVEITGSGALTGGYGDGYVRVAAVSGSDSSDVYDVPEDGSTFTIGGPNDTLINASGGLTPSMVNDVSFGAQGSLEVLAPYGQPAQSILHVLEMRVFYIAPGGVLMYQNGTWEEKDVYKWNGSSWIKAVFRGYSNGSWSS